MSLPLEGRGETDPIREALIAFVEAFDALDRTATWSALGRPEVAPLHAARNALPKDIRSAPAPVSETAEARTPTLVAAIQRALTSWAYMGNGEGWTLQTDVIDPLEGALSREELMATGMTPEAAALRSETAERAEGITTDAGRQLVDWFVVSARLSRDGMYGKRLRELIADIEREARS